MTESKEKLIITPDTKVFDLLEAYPVLERVVAEQVPTFEDLRNPILRNTVAKITSLRQLAKIGEIDLGKFVNHLRKQAGVSDTFEIDGDSLQDGSGRPKWVNESKIAKKLDAKAMLANGEHPVEVVLQEAKELGPDDVYQLITPFLPEPLLDRVKKAGFKVWTEQVGEEYRSYFSKNNGAS